VCRACGSADTYPTALGTVRCNGCGEHFDPDGSPTVTTDAERGCFTRTPAKTGLCRCEYRPGAVCTNLPDGPDGMCLPCRLDGGDGHPNRAGRGSTGG
jgi:hypothetical protein